MGAWCLLGQRPLIPEDSVPGMYKSCPVPQFPPAAPVVDYTTRASALGALLGAGTGLGLGQHGQRQAQVTPRWAERRRRASLASTSSQAAPPLPCGAVGSGLKAVPGLQPCPPALSPFGLASTLWAMVPTGQAAATLTVACVPGLPQLCLLLSLPLSCPLSPSQM